MFKSLIFIILSIVVVQLFNFILKFISFYKQKKNNVNSSNNTSSLNMIQCDKCKIYLTKSEAHLSNGKFFCKDHIN